MEPGKRLAVFSIRKIKNGSLWVRAGSAFVNRDGSMNLYLDVLPIDGQLHVREAGERDKKEAQGNPTAANEATAEVTQGVWAEQAAGGH